MELKDKKLYYVGGVVRDEMIGATSLDIDYCYEGDAEKFAQNYNIIKCNKDFGTVRILLDGKEIDIASTRTETYPKPGRLPVVGNLGCSLCEDLKRRDFTINAMAKRTTDGEIIDPFGGMEDLSKKQIKVLHEKSFIDDPSRIIRALKFSLRFGFSLEAETKQLQTEYLDNINYDMSFHRLKKELKETFCLNKQEAFNCFVSSGMYKLLGENQVVPKLANSIEDILNKYPTSNAWLVYMGFFDLSNFELTRQEKRILEWFERLKSEEPTNNTPFESILMSKIWAGK